MGEKKTLVSNWKEEGGVEVVPKILTELDFDIAGHCEEIYQAQKMLDRLEKEAVNVGLYCSSDKTECQAFNQDPTRATMLY